MQDANSIATHAQTDWRHIVRTSLGYARGLLAGTLFVLGFAFILLSAPLHTPPAFEPLVVPVKLLADTAGKAESPKLMPLVPKHSDQVAAPVPVPQPDVSMSAEIPAALPSTAESAVAPIASTPEPAPVVAPPARLAVLVTDAGLNRRLSSLMAQTLPAAMAVSFSSYAPDLQSSISAFKKTGHETWLELAVRSKKAGVDSGPVALSQSLSLPDNLSMIDLQTKQASGLVSGVLIGADADITSAAEIWAALSKELINRNFIVLDATPQMVPLDLLKQTAGNGLTAYLKANMVLEGQQPRNDFANALDKVTAEAIAARDLVLVVNAPTRLTIEELARWAVDLPQNGVKLVPLSELTGLKP